MTQSYKELKKTFKDNHESWPNWKKSTRSTSRSCKANWSARTVNYSYFAANCVWQVTAHNPTWTTSSSSMKVYSNLNDSATEWKFSSYPVNWLHLQKSMKNMSISQANTCSMRMSYLVWDKSWGGLFTCQKESITCGGSRRLSTRMLMRSWDKWPPGDAELHGKY